MVSDSRSAGHLARREAVQPSLWDRLVDDVPGLEAEIARLRADLGRELGADRLAQILAGGRRAIASDPDLDTLDRRDLSALLSMTERCDYLRERGIVVTPDLLREAVRRDIEALFNIERFECRLQLTPAEAETQEDPADLLADFPQVRTSVLNYGVPSFAGRSARDFDADTLARELRAVIAAFEPRLKRDTIRVKVANRDRSGMRIEIDATLLLSPVPERLRLSTTIDLDNGRASTRLEEL